MILLNFAHPLTDVHITQIVTLTSQKVEGVIEVHSQVDPQKPLAPQVIALAEQAELTPQEWQSEELLVNPPSLNFIAVALLAEHKAQLLAARGEKAKALALDRSAVVYALLRMKDEAVKAIQKEISEGVLYPYLSLINDPRFRNLEDDPRFRSIVARAENSRKIFLKKYGSYF